MVHNIDLRPSSLKPLVASTRRTAVVSVEERPESATMESIAASIVKCPRSGGGVNVGEGVGAEGGGE